MTYSNVDTCIFSPVEDGSYRITIKVSDPNGEFTTFSNLYLRKKEFRYFVDSSDHTMDGFPWHEDGYGISYYPAWLDDQIIKQFLSQVETGKLSQIN